MAKKETQEDGSKASSSLIDLEELANIILGKTNPMTAGGKPFVPLSEKEVAALPKQTQEERAAEYYASIDLDHFTLPGIHVTSDLQIFQGSTIGENALSNHIAASVVNGVPTVTYKSFPKPQ